MLRLAFLFLVVAQLCCEVKAQNRYDTNSIYENHVPSNKDKKIVDSAEGLKDKHGESSGHYYHKKSVEYHSTVHGTGDHDLDLDSMSEGDRSRVGCLETMKKAYRNKDSGVPISLKEIESECTMYAQWGRNMREGKKWQPTEVQMSWWKSLARGIGRDERYARAHRYTRQSGTGQAVRKEYRAMSDNERQNFHDTMKILKASTMDGISKYDLFVNFHQANVAPAGHFGPGFLGYHRELLHRFENALLEINPTISLPYWDSNLDNHLGDDLAQVSMLWSSEFFGNGKGDVTIGPYAYWSIPNPVQGRRTLHRNLTVAPPNARTEPALMPDEAIEFITNARRRRDLTWFVDTTFESHHGSTHNWVGGVMGDLPNSPSDPVFYLHHAFIDCLWEQMRTRQKLREPFFDPQYDYANDSEALGVGIIQPNGRLLSIPMNSPHYSMNIMQPFAPLRNIDGLRNEYFDEFYTCAPSPRCSRQNPHCGSEYLFCDVATFRCAPKLQLDAPCARFNESDVCYKGKCCSGNCKEVCHSGNQKADIELSETTLRTQSPTSQTQTTFRSITPRPNNPSRTRNENEFQFNREPRPQRRSFGQTPQIFPPAGRRRFPGFGFFNDDAFFGASRNGLFTNRFGNDFGPFGFQFPPFG